MIKEHIQIAIVNEQDIEKSLYDCIWSYHTLPNLITGVTPFGSIKGREPGIKMYPFWLGGGNRVNIADSKAHKKVQQHQTKYKNWYDNKHGMKIHKWKEGDWVQVRRSIKEHQNRSKCYPSYEITSVPQCGTVRQ